MGTMSNRRVPIASVNAVEILTNDGTKKERTCKQRLCRYTVITVIILVILLILAFIAIFVILPVIFMNSIEMQRRVIFHTGNDTPSNPEFNNFKKYGIEGVENIFVTVRTEPSISLGLWHILPETLANVAAQDSNFDYKAALANSTYPSVLYFHETNGHRITPINTYKMLREFFHIIAFDYQSYGDSTKGNLSEGTIVQDSVELYKWLHMRTQGEIYLWGHSLGADLSTQTVRELQRLNMTPMGLFLEAPFTTMADQFEYTTISDIFSWLLWYNSTIVQPLYDNGFRFMTKQHILSVDCPIMIMHAEDDSFTPFSLGKELSIIAQENRNSSQGNVTFYSFPTHLGYDHWGIYRSPELPGYIKNHIDVCRQYNETK